MRRSKYLKLVVGFAVVACGQVAPDSTSVVFAPRPDAAPAPASVGAILDIPEGIAILGDHMIDVDGTLGPMPCAPLAPMSSRTGRSRVNVGAFRLAEHETTNEAYAECVRTDRCPLPPADATDRDPTPGPFTSEAKARLPVAVPYAHARAFCRAYGGDLPTLGQLRRAMAGADPGYGIPWLSEALVACGRRAERLPICDVVARDGVYALPRVGETARPLHPVGTAEWDVGPFGHRDLYGNAAEWARGGPPLCSTSDPVMSESVAYGPLLEAPPKRIVAVHPAYGLLYPHGGFPWPRAPHHPEVVYDGPELRPETVAYYTGFRCAFPPGP